MNLIHKKILGYLVMSMVASPLLVSIGFMCQKIVEEHQMEERLEKGSLQTVTVALRDFKWVKEGDEAYVRGSLFDVKTYTLVKDKIVLTGLFDKDEDELNLEQTSFVHGKDGSASPIHQLSSKFLFFPMFGNSSIFTIGNNHTTSMSGCFAFYIEATMELCSPTFTPPPELA